MLLCIVSSIPFTYASSTTVISLSDSKITVNGETISTDTNSNVYVSNQMDNGGTDLSSMTKQENNTMNNRGLGRPGDFRNTETTTSKNNMVIKYIIIGILIAIIVFIIGITIFSFTNGK